MRRIVLFLFVCLFSAGAIRSQTRVPPAGADVEQKAQGVRAGAKLVESFDGLGFGFQGPQGAANVRNPSDNSLAVGPDHIVQIVNTRMAIFTKKGKHFNTTGRVLYGPVVTKAVFAGQRFAARLANDPLGQLTLQETVLMEGEGVQNVMRWQDYTQTAVDPSDDCTIWYVGDYIKKGTTNYSSRIGAFRLPGCGAKQIRNPD